MQKAIQNPKSKIENSESGQAVVMALLALAVGVLLISVFLYYASTSQQATRATGEQTVDRYSADAGIEYGLWQLEQGVAVPFTDTIVVNGQTVTVTIQQVP